MCEDCGHNLDIHDDQGCIGSVHNSDGDEFPCDCKRAGNQTALDLVPE